MSMIVGDTIIETSPQVRCRYFETDCLKDIFLQYFCAGSKWIQSPRPKLLDDSTEILFDGAQCMRFGKHILFNGSTDSHKLGARWLQQMLPEYIIEYVEITDNHIDSLVVPLRPGLLLLSREYKHGVDALIAKLPQYLQKWDHIYAPPPCKMAKSYLPLASPAININLLSLNTETVIVDEEYAKSLAPILSKYKINTIPVRLRHPDIFAGAFHCLTLDTKRKSKLENYFE